MPRQARKKSLSNIYHIMLRGINKQSIFADDEDRRYFMATVRDCKEKSGFGLHAFCLMTNHVHFLIEPGDEGLEVIFKRIGTRYAGWYNRKYQRVGHLFQDRFRSENVETDQYFMVALRYILQNPMKAGMESRPGSYRWSSYLAYESGGNASVTDTQFALHLFGTRDALIEFVQQDSEDAVMDDAETNWRLQDDQAKEIMRQITSCSSAQDFQQLEKPQRKAFIRELYLQKLTMGQIARLTGIAKSSVQVAIKSMDPQIIMERKSLVLREEDTAGLWTNCDEIW